jgi:hypothetical protein
MAEIIKSWSSRISSCEFATVTLRDDGVAMELLDDRGTLRNLVSYEDVRKGALDWGVRNDFGEEVLQELKRLVG